MGIELNLGMLGVVLILLGWVPETLRAWREKQVIDIRFALLYTLGSLLLAIHSYNIGDIAFLVLNSVAFLIGLVNTALSLKQGAL